MRKLGTVAIAFAGLLLLSDAFALISVPVAYLAFPNSMHVSTLVLLTSFLPFIASLVVAVALIAGCGRLSAAWFDDSPLVTSIDETSLLRVGLVVAGVVLATSGLAALLNVLSSGLISAAQIQFIGGHATSNWLGLVGRAAAGVLNLAVGIALVTDSERLAIRLLSSPRTVTEQSPDGDA